MDRAALAARLEPVRRTLAPATRVVRRALAPVTGLGWTLVVVGVVSWWTGVRLGWDELLVLAAACAVPVLIGVLCTIGRLALDVTVDVAPARVVVGGDAVGRVVVRSLGRPSLGARVEVPVGRGLAVFETGALGPSSTFEEPFVVPTSRRAVVVLGPASSVKGDPLGIARREVTTGEATQLFVHPVTTRLPALSTGWLRDLEGRATNDLSPSDVAFHTLREYVPGDDRRHIHWRSSAKLGELMVRQFVDTRRSHLGLVLATDRSHWASDDEFELGVSVVGSLGRTALLDDQEVTMVAGTRVLPATTPSLLLDGLAGAEPEDLPDVRELAVRSVPQLGSATVIALVVGSAVDLRSLQAACEPLDRSSATVLAIRVVPGVEASRRAIGHVSMLEVGSLDDLARVLIVVGAR